MRQCGLNAGKARGENAEKQISNLGRSHDVDLTLDATKFPESVQISKMFLWKSNSDTRNGCLARTRTYDSLRQREALTKADAHLDAHKLRDSSELIEVIKAWAALPAPFKKAILALVRPNGDEGNR